MKWEEFYEKFGETRLITPQMVYAFGKDWRPIQVQISRWVKDGKLIKLSRQKYILSKIYQKKEIPMMYLANYLVYPSYVSLEYALGFYNLIPEAVYTLTSVTTRRPGEYVTKVGRFIYKHVKKELFWGYQSERQNTTEVLLASPEKALIDIFYFWKGKVTKERIDEMRFQNLDQISIKKLLQFSQKTKSKKLRKIVQHFLIPLIEREKKQ